MTTFVIEGNFFDPERTKVLRQSFDIVAKAIGLDPQTPDPSLAKFVMQTLVRASKLCAPRVSATVLADRTIRQMQAEHVPFAFSSVTAHV